MGVETFQERAALTRTTLTVYKHIVAESHGPSELQDRIIYDLVFLYQRLDTTGSLRVVMRYLGLLPLLDYIDILVALELQLDLTLVQEDIEAKLPLIMGRLSTYQPKN